MVCYGRRIIVSIDKPDHNNFYDKISIYIINNRDIMVLEKIDRNRHKLLKNIFSNVNNMNKFDEILNVPSPQSTFDENIIKSKMGNPADILHSEYVGIYFNSTVEQVHKNIIL